VVVPLPETSGMWQREWVEQERKKKESQMTGGPGIEAPVVASGGVVRQLVVQEVEETEPRVKSTSSVLTLTLQPGEIRELVAVVSDDGDVQGWVETKRAADDMEETIVVDPSARLRKRQATESAYPRAGASHRDAAAPPTPRVSFADEEDEEIPDTEQSEQADDSQDETLQHEQVDSTREAPAAMTQKKKRNTSTGATQGPRKVPVKLRAEAEPEKMVDKILNQTIDDITIREVLGLSPDLLREIWGIRRFPTVKASIPTTQVTEQDPVVIADELEVRRMGATMNAVPHETKDNAIEATQHLYACASPMVLGKVEDRYRVNMLIDSGSEMCVMSKALWQRMMAHLPIDTDISWSVGSANATQNRVYRVCHSVSISIGGVEIEVPVFVLEGAAQDSSWEDPGSAKLVRSTTTERTAPFTSRSRLRITNARQCSARWPNGAIETAMA
jgi:hypothetical protein